VVATMKKINSKNTQSIIGATSIFGPFLSLSLVESNVVFLIAIVSCSFSGSNFCEHSTKGKIKGIGTQPLPLQELDSNMAKTRTTNSYELL
jgi:hypothetical protein